MHGMAVTATPTATPVEGEALGRRERKKRDTRKALASAAVRLAAERGPDQITIEDIAEAADVSVRTFFNYFSSKEEAIIGVNPEGQAAFAARLLVRPADESPFEAVRNVFRDTFTGDDMEWADERVARQELVRRHASLLPRHLAAHHDLELHLRRALEERMGVEPDSSLYPSLLVTT